MSTAKQPPADLLESLKVTPHLISELQMWVNRYEARLGRRRVEIDQLVSEARDTVATDVGDYIRKLQGYVARDEKLRAEHRLNIGALVAKARDAVAAGVAEFPTWKAWLRYAHLKPAYADEMLATLDLPEEPPGSHTGRVGNRRSGGQAEVAQAVQPTPQPQASDQPRAPAADPLDVVAGQINARLKIIDKLEEHRIAVAVQLQEAKQRVANGEAGEGVTWVAWVEANIHRTMRDVNKLLAIAASPDPAAAIQVERAKAKDRMARVRSVAGANVRPDHNETASDEFPIVQQVMALIGRMNAAERAVFDARYLMATVGRPTERKLPMQ